MEHVFVNLIIFHLESNVGKYAVMDTYSSFRATTEIRLTEMAVRAPVKFRITTFASPQIAFPQVNAYSKVELH